MTPDSQAAMKADERACYFYRDRDGFCHLTNRCWAGRSCPRTQRQADNARLALIGELIAARDKKKGSK